MPDDAMILAVGRLERALARVERAAERRAASPSLPLDAPIGDADLQMRHDRLKAETRAAIASIDKLLGNGG